MLTGKGCKQRRVRFGTKTADALRRYVLARGRRPGLAGIDQLWIAAKGARPLKPNGIKIRLKKLGDRAGVEHVHAQQWRHGFAHEWKLAGGHTGDLMLLIRRQRGYGTGSSCPRSARRRRAPLKPGSLPRQGGRWLGCQICRRTLQIAVGRCKPDPPTLGVQILTAVENPFVLKIAYLNGSAQPSACANGQLCAIDDTLVQPRLCRSRSSVSERLVFAALNLHRVEAMEKLRPARPARSGQQ